MQFFLANAYLWAAMQVKLKRQHDLVALLKRGSFSSQEEVVNAMREKGFEVTQPSISRDLRELGVVKLDGRYVPMESRGAASASPSLSLVREVIAAGENLLVVKTASGAASVVAASIDSARHSDIVGTIAGDDTIFIAVRSTETHDGLREFIYSKSVMRNMAEQ